VNRRFVNEELAKRARERFDFLLEKLSGREIAPSEVEKRAADFASTNRASRRRHYGERSDGRYAPSAATMATSIKTHRRAK
jgi:hypothetical protein